MDKISIGDKVRSNNGDDHGWIAEPFGFDADHPMNRPGNVFVSWASGVKTWTPIEDIAIKVEG